MNTKTVILLLVLLIIFGIGFYTVSRKNSSTTEDPQPIIESKTPTQTVEDSVKIIDDEINKLTDDNLNLDDL